MVVSSIRLHIEHHFSSFHHQYLIIFLIIRKFLARRRRGPWVVFRSVTSHAQRLFFGRLKPGSEQEGKQEQEMESCSEGRPRECSSGPCG